MNPYVIGGVAVAAFSAGFMVNGWRLNAQISEIEAANSKAVAEATAKAMDESTRMQRKKDDALKQAQQAALANARSADAARAERDGLRDQLDTAASNLPGATCAAARDYGATATAVLGECGAALEDLARKADGHALDARTLIQSWPTTESSK
jgi:hypothetical protein